MGAGWFDFARFEAISEQTRQQTMAAGSPTIFLQFLFPHLLPSLISPNQKIGCACAPISASSLGSATISATSAKPWLWRARSITFALD
jgi:hypothetical protein